MILSRHTAICDGCGALGPTSDRSPSDAIAKAMAAGWTHDGLARNPTHNWCPACTEARKET